MAKHNAAQQPKSEDAINPVTTDVTAPAVTEEVKAPEAPAPVVTEGVPDVFEEKKEEVKATTVKAGKVTLILGGRNIFHGLKSVEDIVKEMVRFPAMTVRVDSQIMITSVVAAGKAISANMDLSKRVYLSK